MKIMAGMGSIDDYPSMVKAGCHEVFVGYVPHSWMEERGVMFPLNRREVVYCNVQIGSESELMILKDMVDHYGISVSITLNSLAYDSGDYGRIKEIVERCMHLGFRRYIMADLHLIAYLQEQLPEIEICVSGELGEMNHRLLHELSQMGVRRVIFPRQTSIDEMKEMIKCEPDLQYEAFALNEKCHFTGAYCNSVHCDELCHICRIPYRLDGPSARMNQEKEEEEYISSYAPGSSGCGLCALWDLRAAGITHLKLVSRGNREEDTLRDIESLRAALEILQDAASKEVYTKIMKKALFPHGCSGNCYYIDPKSKYNLRKK